MGEPAPPPTTTPPFPADLVPPATPAAPNGTQPPAVPTSPVPPEADPAAELRQALAAERARHVETQQALAALKAQGMTEQEKAIAAAKAEGRAEAVREAGLKVAAAEFRALAAGKLADPAAALELLDLSRFVKKNGDVDSEALAAAVEKLIGQLGPRGPAVPGGPMSTQQPQGEGGDFIRQVLGRQRG